MWVAPGEEESFEGQESGPGNGGEARAEPEGNGPNLRIGAGCNRPATGRGANRRGRENGEVGRRAGGARALATPLRTSRRAERASARRTEAGRGLWQGSRWRGDLWTTPRETVGAQSEPERGRRASRQERDGRTENERKTRGVVALRRKLPTRPFRWRGPRSSRSAKRRRRESCKTLEPVVDAERTEGHGGPRR